MKNILAFIVIYVCGLHTAAALDTSKPLTPAEAAEAQLVAYNARDIDAFVSVYADDIKIYAHPNKLLYEGMDIFRKRYASLFERAADLQATVTKRMVIGNIVIDEEEGIANGNKFHAIAIYDVNPNTGKIDKVWFIQ